MYDERIHHLSSAIHHLEEATKHLTTINETDIIITYKNTLLNVECRIRGTTLTLETILHEIEGTK